MSAERAAGAEHDHENWWYKPNRRLTGPADISIDERMWRRWSEWIGAIADAFHWRPFTVDEVYRMGIEMDFRLTAPEMETLLLRNMVGIPVEGKMVVATKNPRVWRLFYAATERASLEFDEAMFAAYGSKIGWPELWANRHLTPFGQMSAGVFEKGWEAWAGVEDCRCGRTALHVERFDNGRPQPLWLMTRTACRPQASYHADIVDDLRQHFGEGCAFTSGEIIEEGIETVAHLRVGLDPTNERALGRQLAIFADSIPPGGSEWFMVRLGGQAISNRVAFAVVSWNTPPPVHGT